jgi:zinc transport system ATP-binding protein
MSETAIETRRLSLRFGATEALRDINMQVPAGAFMAVIGPNGAGKSTLLRVLLGVQKVDQGDVLLFGQRPDALPASDLGYVPQVKTLDRSFPARAIELVVSGLRGTWPWRITPVEREQALAAMERTGVAHLAQQSVQTLSGGELQRVYLARVIARGPKLILLDEPAGGIDLAGEADMYHLLEGFQKQTGATIIMITHDWEGARIHADHVLLMQRGLAAFGAPDAVATDERLLEVFGHTGHRAISGGRRHA